MMMSITAVRTSDGSKVNTCNITGSKNTSGEISQNRWSPAQWLPQLVSTESTTSDQQPRTIAQASGARVAPVPRKSDPQPPYAGLTGATQAELPEARQAVTPAHRDTKPPRSEMGDLVLLDQIVGPSHDGDVRRGRLRR
jgi:hypothetical protein